MLSPALTETLKELGYEKLTPVQEQSLPILLEGRDLVGRSKTGSGKTVAFSLPILERLELERRDVQALVLCPTRELCEQVAREIRKLGRKLPGFQVLIVSGGQPGRPQRDALHKGVHVVVGTPGRVLDHLSRGNFYVDAIKTLVLDEADRMLDMGFEEEMTAILDAIPASRQTVFFSATFPDSVERMSARYQKNPAVVEIKDTDAEKPAIEQIVFDVKQEDKPEALLHLLKEYEPRTALVFCNLKVTVAELAETLKKQGVAAAGLHGDLEQEDRHKVMAMFRNESLRVLVATDVAARGLDVADLDLVVTYDLSLHLEDYIHRIGRTGRAGKSGAAVTLATPRERVRLIEFEREAGFKISTGQLAKMSGGANLPHVSLEAKMATVYVSGGRKDKVRPGDILGALTGETAGLSGADIGKIEIFDRFAFVAVTKGRAEAVVEKLKVGKVKGRSFLLRLIRS